MGVETSLAAAATPPAQTLVVHSMSLERGRTLLVELRGADDTPLPSFEAGAHVELQLAPALRRSYSLIGDPAERQRYLVAVRHETAGRGGSRYVHEQLRVGQRVAVSAPRNHFALCEDATLSLLVAGGIGITPLWAMARRLEQLGRRWELHYAMRSRAEAPLLERVVHLGASSRHGRVQLYPSAGPGLRRLEMPALLGAAPAEAHLYCCGPARMMADFQAATLQRDPATLHREHFSAPVSAGPAPTEGFTVKLAASGSTLHVPAESSLLHVLLEHGVPLAHSCEQGVCGSCEVVVVEGDIEHRDAILTEQERREGRSMMACCSRARSGHLVIAL
jgi:vanillate O-demethylase ferredoxin subunit